MEEIKTPHLGLLLQTQEMKEAQGNHLNSLAGIYYCDGDENSGEIMFENPNIKNCSFLLS